MGRSPPLFPVAFNCAAPDTGNIEILLEHGTPEQRDRWLLVFQSRVETERARLPVLDAAHQMDTIGESAARHTIAMAKVIAANVVMQVLDRAVQVHGALGLADDTPLAGLWRAFRFLRLADGADEVHKITVARHEFDSGRTANMREPNSGPGRASQPDTEKEIRKCPHPRPNNSFHRAHRSHAPCRPLDGCSMAHGS